MTRKDYQLMAKEFKELMVSEESVADVGYNNGVKDAINVLCGVLKADNPRFDKAKFVAACEVKLK